jgi:hypothetical protein
VTEIPDNWEQTLQQDAEVVEKWYDRIESSWSNADKDKSGELSRKETALMVQELAKTTQGTTLTTDCETTEFKDYSWVRQE